MTAVADSSALVASVVNSGSDSRWMDAAFADEDMVCPELAIAESSNILRRMELAGRYIAHGSGQQAYAVDCWSYRRCTASLRPIR